MLEDVFEPDAWAFLEVDGLGFKLFSAYTELDQWCLSAAIVQIVLSPTRIGVMTKNGRLYYLDIRRRADFSDEHVTALSEMNSKSSRYVRVVNTKEIHQRARNHLIKVSINN